MKYNDIRRKSKEIAIGDVKIGGQNPIAVQSMTNVCGYDEIYSQMKRLEEKGCQIIRMSVPDMESAEILGRLKKSDIRMPIVADIHFDWRLAIAAAEQGADKIRINPGNIGSNERIEAVAKICKERAIPIRVGVNGGSVSRKGLDKYGSPTPEYLVENALENVRLLENYDFNNIVVAVKSSSVLTAVNANKLLASKTEYPIHVGITEAGGGEMGLIKGSAGIGSCLTAGVGDTIRVSLTNDPCDEVDAAISILRSLGFYSKPCINVVSCPTCARTKIDLIEIASKVEKMTRGMNVSRDITVAVMGCVVNGPGEGKDADVGIAGGNGEAVLFCRGEIVGKISEEDIIPVLMKAIEDIDKGRL